MIRDLVFYAASYAAVLATACITVKVAVDGGAVLVEPNPIIIWGEVAACVVLLGYGAFHLYRKVKETGLKMRWEAEKKRFYK
jgi:hypothetical protein